MPKLDTLLAQKAPAADPAAGVITGSQRSFDEEGAKPLKMSKEFDNFNATVKLAALTQQTAEFREYITETQKMRAYKGEVPLAATVVATPIPRGDITGTNTSLRARGSPLIPLLLLGGLALVVVGLLVVLLR